MQFAQTVTFFRNLVENTQSDILRRCVNVIQCKLLNSQETLFKVGDFGTQFFIILKGSVGINIRLPNLEDPEKFDLKEVNVLKAGASFGELALLNDNAKRTATIITKEDCIFACMEKNQYRNILGRIEEAKIQNKIAFLCSVSLIQNQFPFFSSWSFREVKTISYHFEPIQTNLNQIIIKQKDFCNHFYVICEGEFDVQYTVNIQQGLFTRQARQHTHTICRLGPGEFFGEEAFLLDGTSEFAIKLNVVPITKSSQAQRWAPNCFSIVCRSQNGVIYKITREDIQRRFWDSKTQFVFMRMLGIIYEYRKRIANGIQKNFEEESESRSYNKSLQLFQNPLAKQKIQQQNILNVQSAKIIDKDPQYDYYKDQEKRALAQFKKLYMERNCSYAQVKIFFNQKDINHQTYFDKQTYNKLFFRFKKGPVQRIQQQTQSSDDPSIKVVFNSPQHESQLRKFRYIIPTEQFITIQRNKSANNLQLNIETSQTDGASPTLSSAKLRVLKQKLFHIEQSATTRAVSKNLRTTTPRVLRISTGYLHERKQTQQFFA